MAVVMAPVAATAKGVTEMAVVMAPAAATAEGVTEMAVVMLPAAATAEEVTEMAMVIGMTTEMAPAAAAATVAGETETTSIAKFTINSSKLIFLPFHAQTLSVIQLILNMACGLNVQFVSQS